MSFTDTNSFFDNAIKRLHGTCSACKHYTAYHRKGKCENCKHDNANDSFVAVLVDNWEYVDDVEKYHAKWKHRKTWTKYVCSNCSFESDNGYRYCPHCGSRMDGD